jgi:hypothetical protein
MMAPEQCNSLYSFLIGIPLIESLHEMRPPLSGKTLEESALSAKQRQGYEECLNNIISLANRGMATPMQSPYVDIRRHDQPVEGQAA